MDRPMRWIVVFLIVGAFYFASSGLTFVFMYSRPKHFSPRVATFVYSPLEWIARRSRFFARFYTRFHWWCWRVAGRPGMVKGAPDMPPPPPSIPSGN